MDTEQILDLIEQGLPTPLDARVLAEGDCVFAPWKCKLLLLRRDGSHATLRLDEGTLIAAVPSDFNETDLDKPLCEDGPSWHSMWKVWPVVLEAEKADTDAHTTT